jgi:hypothetical protein
MLWLSLTTACRVCPLSHLPFTCRSPCGLADHHQLIRKSGLEFRLATVYCDCHSKQEGGRKTQSTGPTRRSAQLSWRRVTCMACAICNMYHLCWQGLLSCKLLAISSCCLSICKITHRVVAWKKVLPVLARGKINKVHGLQLLFLYISYLRAVSSTAIQLLMYANQARPLH